MYEVKTDEAQSKISLFFKGSLTVQNAVMILSCIAQSINGYQNIVVDQTLADEYDSSYLQILISLNKSAEAAGKKLELITSGDTQFMDTVCDLGFDYGTGLTSIISSANFIGEQDA